MSAEQREIQQQIANARYRSFVDGAMRLSEASTNENFLPNAERFLRDLTPEATLEFLQAICESDEALETIAKATHRHPNGFYRIVLGESTQGALRLHVWDESIYSQQGENIHNHAFIFASRIITGELPTEYYETTEDQTQPAFIHSVRTRAHLSGERTLTEQGETHLQMTDMKVFRQGDVYTTDDTVIHRVPALSVMPTATLLLSRIVKEDSDIFSTKTIHENEDTYDPISSQQLKGILQGVIAASQS